ncbi:MAG: serine/threonine protein kinase, partial [Xanthomonadales bacterium]|nr:serine/threonine protein kinase [Xanthomonadales bacterium]
MKKFGHYEVTAELGRGGMGVVYKGFEPSLNRKVAIKCLAKHLLDDKDLVERFTREAKATAALNDPNVIQIYYIGEEEGQPFFAMEYIEGRSLDDLLKGGNTLSVSHAKNILKQACSGLEAAHKIGLVHRDIKPANMMITNDGTLKIVDFGIARTREYGDKLTNTGEFVGTPGYLSPEVCIGKEVDARSDIFSLGIVFYEMLAGKVPFENDSPLGLMLEVVQSEIPDIRTLNNKVDKKTSYILNKMIAKSPDERYQSCSDIIRDLGNTIDNQDIKAIQSESKVVKHTVTKKKISEQITLPGVATVTSNQLVTTQQKQPGSSKLWLIAATLFAVVAAAGFGYYKGYFPIPGAKDDSNQPMMTLADDNLMKAGLTSGSQDMKQTGDDSLAGIVTDEENFLADTDDIANDDSFDETEVINETDNNVIADVDSGVVTEQMLTADNIDSDQTQATMNTSVSELAV